MRIAVAPYRRRAGRVVSIPTQLPLISHTLIGAHLPKGWTYDALHGPLKAKGFCIYAAQGALKPSAFRIGLIGHFGADAVDGLFREMGALLKR